MFVETGCLFTHIDTHNRERETERERERARARGLQGQRRAGSPDPEECDCIARGVVGLLRRFRSRSPCTTLYLASWRMEVCFRALRMGWVGRKGEAETAEAPLLGGIGDINRLYIKSVPSLTVISFFFFSWSML